MKTFLLFFLNISTFVFFGQQRVPTNFANTGGVYRNADIFNPNGGLSVRTAIGENNINKSKYFHLFSIFLPSIFGR